MNPHHDLLQRLIDETTAVEIRDRENDVVIFERDIDFENHPMRLQGRDLFDFSTLEHHWENKWASFGNRWTNERQIYRFLWYEIRAFTDSFRQYKENFGSALNLSFEHDNQLVSQRNRHDLRAELAIRSMYEYGKQAIDLIQELLRTDTNLQDIVTRNQNNIFLEKFKETRNKFLIHYQNPNRFRDLFFDPSFISLEGTGSLFEIYIHTRDQREHRYSVYVNHMSDYFRLETILTNIVESF